MHTTFNVTDLIPFTGSHDDEVDHSDLRTNPLQERGMMEEGPDKVQLQDPCQDT